MNYTFAKPNIVKSVAVFAVVVLAGIAILAPTRAHAGNLFDPLCLWSGCGSGGTKNVTNTTTNNVNSNVNSPGGVVSTGSTGTPVYVPVPTPVYTYNYPTSYSYSALNATCYATPTSVGVGDTVTWRVSAYGGNGSYFYSWSGSDGFGGNGSSISTSYGNPGTKHATVTVTSGNQTISRNCDNSVYVYDDYYYNNNNYNYNYNSNYNNYSYYNPLTVSCSADTSFAPVGQNVRWSAYASGGRGGYTYRWGGTDNIYGTGQSLGVNYGSAGTKYATVTVYSDGQSVTRDCTGSVLVGVRNDQIYNGNTRGNLEIACFADTDRVRVGVPVTWAVEATGGDGSNYSYAWTGSEGLTGSGRSAVTTYNTTGTKSATVSVTSGGVSASKICGNIVTVVSGASTRVTPVPQNTQNNDNNQQAASFFSFKNVPWGWVAVLVILVLFSMVLYLLFTRRDVVEVKK